MLFNSLNFAIFFPVVFVAYWFIFRKSVRSQNIILVIASYIFYGFWDWRFLFLLAFSTGLDYFTGIKIHNSPSEKVRKIWLLISVITNLGFLGFFKYYNFFADSFADFISLFGLKPDFVTLNIILPVGISFYTFHGLSYVFDIYNRKISPTVNLIDYTLFVSFFPLLVAGPIERATHLLPQVIAPRTFNYTKAVDGLRQILWGLFKKMVIADNCAQYANLIFDNNADYHGSTLVLGAVFFAFQIYGDFSGYSDIALGTARLLGFELLQNFKFPYFSRDIAEFWRRWHVSLSSWFRDYLYIPLGGNSGNQWIRIRNTFIIFIVSGFWHGANWTFLAWGLLNALYFLPLLLMGKNRNNLEVVAAGKIFPGFADITGIIVTFSMTTFAWIFFRAENMHHAIEYISGIYSPSILIQPEIDAQGIITLALTGAFLVVEWIGREGAYGIAHIGLTLPRFLRWTFYAFIIFIIAVFMETEESPFIYFQF